MAYYPRVSLNKVENSSLISRGVGTLVGGDLNSFQCGRIVAAVFFLVETYAVLKVENLPLVISTNG